MDVRNVRIMKDYPDKPCPDDNVYIDEAARDALHIQWGDEVLLVGRRSCVAKVLELKDEDTGAQVIRMNEKMLDNVYCCVGDELLLYDKE